MKPSSNRRTRSRPNNNNQKRQGGGGRNSYESNGPDGKVRGTAQQILEKYQALGQDATSAGDRIAAEAYFQFAEHYYRVVNVDGPPQQQQQPRRESNTNDQQQQDSAPSGNNAANSGNTETESSKQEPLQAVAENTPEVVNVPIMPGPINVPVSQEPEKTESSVQAEVQADLLTDAIEPNDEAGEDMPVEKAKPVRRRRPRAKPSTETKPDAEVAQA